MVQAYSENNSNRLFILGVIHRDERGSELLREWLSKITPEVITLEFSNYGLAFRKKRGEEFKKRLENILDEMNNNEEIHSKEALFSLLSYINMPYEYEVATQYAEEHNVLIYLIDMDIFSSSRLEEAENLFEENNIKQLLCGPVSSQDKEKIAARLFFEKGIKLFSYTDEMLTRDVHMSNRIASLMKDSMNKKFLHICGWQHLQDPYGVYTPLKPIKVFFYDKTICI